MNAQTFYNIRLRSGGYLRRVYNGHVTKSFEVVWYPYEATNFIEPADMEEMFAQCEEQYPDAIGNQSTIWEAEQPQ